MSQSLPKSYIWLAEACIIDMVLKEILAIGKHAKTYRRPGGSGRTTGAESHARQVACGKRPTANSLPPTLSTTQEISVCKRQSP